MRAMVVCVRVREMVVCVLAMIVFACAHADIVCMVVVVIAITRSHFMTLSQHDPPNDCVDDRCPTRRVCVSSDIL